MEFLTYKSINCQTEEKDITWTLHNQLFLDYDNKIYLTPRFFRTDGHTIPECTAWIAGGHTSWDVRPAQQHDLECRYHQYILVHLTKEELMNYGYLKLHRKKIGDSELFINICENIPKRHLSIENTTFKETNARYKRMLEAVHQIPQWRIDMMGWAVNFNLNWFLREHKILDKTKIYKDYL